MGISVVSRLSKSGHTHHRSMNFVFFSIPKTLFLLCMMKIWSRNVSHAFRHEILHRMMCLVGGWLRIENHVIYHVISGKIHVYMLKVWIMVVTWVKFLRIWPSSRGERAISSSASRIHGWWLQDAGLTTISWLSRDIWRNPCHHYQSMNHTCHLCEICTNMSE